MEKYKNIDAYIADFPKDVQTILRKIRAIILEAAPKAEEKISYGMPAFKLHGQLVFFAAREKHIGFYPHGNSAIWQFRKELEEYETSKGTIQFPLDKPIPYDLIQKIVERRVKENLTKKGK